MSDTMFIAYALLEPSSDGTSIVPPMAGPSDAGAVPFLHDGNSPQPTSGRGGPGESTIKEGDGGGISRGGISKNPDGKSHPSSAHGASAGHDWLSGQAKLFALSVSLVDKQPVQHQYNRNTQYNPNTAPPLAALTLTLTLTLTLIP
ncbi:hypothetical protein PAAG_03434 [Paracoccidioides lutzii Pb01]|uniref:Uncharacterized protein n=1 Tax=Paracoccidioides lutzii (strain ATCC MYA-826 / Pb01) TaxID=502779 RepID=C1GX60_PARBA|nr:hypothetical protein PAAG_03434 [Paracoccidioides lutzii Pb01]EEH41148.2 hypothetical protein PAAG_03434 [Paracoccidioides lutzii Pb01]